jgi:hypothetical protein
MFFNKFFKRFPAGIAHRQKSLPDLYFFAVNGIDVGKGYDERIVDADKLIFRQLRFERLHGLQGNDLLVFGINPHVVFQPFYIQNIAL